MKKIYSIIFMMLILLSFSCVHATNIDIVVSPQKVMVNGTYKDFEVYNIDGNNFFKLRDIAHSLNGTFSQFSVDYNAEKKMIEVQKGKKYTSLGSEMKIGEDKSETAVKSSQSLAINGQNEELTAYNIDGNNFFKLRELGSKLDFNVSYDEPNNVVLVDSKKEGQITNITDVVAKIFNGIVYVEVTSNIPVESYNAFSLVEPDRIILDIPNSKLELSKRDIMVNYNGLAKVRLGDQGNNVNRVVLDLNEATNYKIAQSEDKKTIYLALSENFKFTDLTLSPEKVLLVYNGSIISIPNSDKDIELPPNGEAKSGEASFSGEILESGDNTKVEIPVKDDLKNRVTINSIKYSALTDKVKITGDKDFKYKELILENPYRIIIDIENAVLNIEGPTTITPNNKNVSEIRFSQTDTTTVRVVFEMKTETEYSIKEKNEMIEVILKEPTYKNLSYYVYEDYAEIILYNVKKSVFTTSETSTSNKYILKYSESRFSAGKEKLEFDDDYVKNIDIKSGKITIDGQKSVDFKLKQDGDNVVVRVQSKDENSNSSNEDFIILLDAGHGGTDPGSCHGDTEAEKHLPENQEKTYNLAIMLKVKELLEENGYTVYATRTTDKALTVNDRVGLATEEHPEASLYVSVHNNSLANDKYTGTLIMYCDRETPEYNISSKQLAEYVLEELISELNTVNRGFIKVAQDDTSKRVLTEVPMPSILCEIAFISNDEEFERLKTEEFQDAAAEAIFNGIVSAQKQMSK